MWRVLASRFLLQTVNVNATAQQLVAVKVAAAVAAAKHKYQLHFSTICTAASRPEPSHISAPLIAPLHSQRTNLDQRDVSATEAWKIQKQGLRDRSTQKHTRCWGWGSNIKLLICHAKGLKTSVCVLCYFNPNEYFGAENFHQKKNIFVNFMIFFLNILLLPNTHSCSIILRAVAEISHLLKHFTLITNHIPHMNSMY